MKPFAYPLAGILPDGKYLPGNPSWNAVVVLSQAMLSCMPPSAGTLSLYLEIGGVRTDFCFVVPAGTKPVTLMQDFFVTIPAGQMVRWVASFNDAPENAASGVGLLLTVAIPGAVVLPLLAVWDGQTGLIAYTYDPVTQFFTPATSVNFGWVLTQTNADWLQMVFGGTVGMQVTEGAFYTPALTAMGGVAQSTMPQAIFCVGRTPVATVSAAGLSVVDFVEGAPVTPSVVTLDYYSGFQFFSSGILTGRLTTKGLAAITLIEAS